MTKAETVTKVAGKAGLTQSDAGKAVDAILEALEQALANGDEVTFTGFGKFTVSERSARQGVNPQTGEKINIAAAKVPRFSAGSKLKQAVR